MLTDGIHLSIYPDLDPVSVACIADGYGTQAAFERWSPWSKKAVKVAALRGRRILESLPAESGTVRQPARDAGGRDPAGGYRPQQFDGIELEPLFRPHGVSRRPPHL